MILFRLVHNRKIVGFEKHGGGRIYHRFSGLTQTGEEYYWCDILDAGFRGNLSGYIPHDRKDMYTGIEVDGKKLFQRDKIQRGDDIGVVRYGEHQSTPIEEYTDYVIGFYIDGKSERNIKDVVYNKDNKIIGTEGVDDE